MTSDIPPRAQTLQSQIDDIGIELVQPLEETVSDRRLQLYPGSGSAARCARFAKAFELTMTEQIASQDQLACFHVGMRIDSSKWCNTTCVKYAPDYVLVNNTADKTFALVFEAVAMIEIVWSNRDVFDEPTAIDPGLAFPRLQSYIMLDYREPRLILFRRSTSWQPEVFCANEMPSRIEGLTFSMDWLRAYDCHTPPPRIDLLQTVTNTLLNSAKANEAAHTSKGRSPEQSRWDETIVHLASRRATFSERLCKLSGMLWHIERSSHGDQETKELAADLAAEVARHDGCTNEVIEIADEVLRVARQLPLMREKMALWPEGHERSEDELIASIHASNRSLPNLRRWFRLIHVFFRLSAIVLGLVFLPYPTVFHGLRSLPQDLLQGGWTSFAWIALLWATRFPALAASYWFCSALTLPNAVGTEVPWLLRVFRCASNRGKFYTNIGLLIAAGLAMARWHTPVLVYLFVFAAMTVAMTVFTIIQKPSILFLSSSPDVDLKVLKRVIAIALPHRVVVLLDEDRFRPPVVLSPFDNLRVRNTMDWTEVVSHLTRVVDLVVCDSRSASANVSREALMLHDACPEKSVFLMGDLGERPATEGGSVMTHAVSRGKSLAVATWAETRSVPLYRFDRFLAKVLCGPHGDGRPFSSPASG